MLISSKNAQQKRFINQSIKSTTNITTGTLLVDPVSYKKAEKRANWYLTEVEKLTQNEAYLDTLLHDYQAWQNSNHQQSSNKRSLSFLTTPDIEDTSLNSWSYLEKLAAEKKLKRYLTKSISYIFLRDLGCDLGEKKTQKNIASTVTRLRRWIKKNSSSNHANDDFLHAILYTKAKENNLEATLAWLMNKLARVQQNMPKEIDQNDGMRKLVKIIAGVVLHQLINLNQEATNEQKRVKMDAAIRLGYCYGLTYPFIDDLQDSSSALNEQEKLLFNRAIRESLLSGHVVDCPSFRPEKQKQMLFIYQELREAFELIKSCQSKEDAKDFFEQAFIFFEAQDIDRSRKLSTQPYSTQELFLPIILKSAGCRLVARELVDSNQNDNFNQRTFCFGIYNQFNDDIKDIFDDIEEGNVTPYTYFLQQQASNTEQALINPYRIYWAVVFYLINRVYGNNQQTKALLLERSINAHRSLKNAIGKKRYQKLRGSLLTTGHQQFDNMIDLLVEEPSEIAWFDKLVSRQVSEQLTTQKQTLNEFKQRYDEVQKIVNASLAVKPHHKLEKSTLVEAANYSVKAGGKRLRSVIAYVMCTDKYHFSHTQTMHVVQLLEYMHTASIIFDDKPSQDNSDFRRGKQALHKHYNCEATAELSGVFLMMRAVEIQSQIKDIDPQRVLDSLTYSANTTQAICEGQLLDLKSTPNNTDIKQLELMSHLKTGLAIEAALMIPAILAGENDIEKGHIKQFAKHLGLAFQIKDDLLDYSGDSEKLGKPVGQDADISKASFVTCLGEEGANQKLFSHYFEAQTALQSMGEVKSFMRELLDLVVYRDA